MRGERKAMDEMSRRGANKVKVRNFGESRIKVRHRNATRVKDNKLSKSAARAEES